jgi:ribosomal protein S18 acetylase RimI-like enzyme
VPNGTAAATPSPALEFRRARLADVEAIVALVESAYRGDASRAGWTTEADLLDGQRTDAGEVGELVASDSARILLAFRGRELVGSVMLVHAVDPAHVGMLAVHPELQAHGIGRALLAEVERVIVHERLACRVQMTVIAQRSELIAWYGRRGYALTSETQRFPYGEPRFGLPRRPDLYFRVLEKTLEP